MKKAKCFKCKRVLTYNPSFAGKGEFVKNKRRIICPNEGFTKQLKIWQKKGYKYICENSKD